MTDLEKFIELYESVGITLKPEPESKYDRETCEYSSTNILALTLTAGDHEKLDGYSGFLTHIKFTLDGEFVGQGFWE